MAIHWTIRSACGFAAAALTAIACGAQAPGAGESAPGSSAAAVVASDAGTTGEIASTLLSSTGQSECLAVQSDGYAYVEPCGSTQQQWTLNSNGTIQQVGTSQCLDVYNDGQGPSGALVIGYPCNAADPAQQWQLQSDGHIAWTGSGKCLNISGGVAKAGAQAIVWTCDSESNEFWKVTAGTNTNTTSDCRYTGCGKNALCNPYTTQCFSCVGEPSKAQCCIDSGGTFYNKQSQVCNYL